MGRLRTVLDEGPIEAMWCYSAPPDLVSNRGGLDSLETYIKLAKAEIGKGRNPEYVKEIEVRSPRRQFQRPENGERSTSVQVSRHQESDWGFSKNPNRPKR